MHYNNEAYEDDGFSGEPQESDGVIHGDEMGPSGSDAQDDYGKDDIAGEINNFLKQPRFPGDICITLSMPESYLKKAKDKVNLALWNAHKKYARTCRRKDRDGKEYDVPGFGMFDILLTLSPFVDPIKLNAILDNEIKQVVAKERGIHISDEELDYVVKHPVGSAEKKDDSIVTCPECHGSGEIDGEECPLCLGQGKVMRVVEDVPQAEGDFDSMNVGDAGLEDLMEAFGR